MITTMYYYIYLEIVNLYRVFLNLIASGQQTKNSLACKGKENKFERVYIFSEWPGHLNLRVLFTFEFKCVYERNFWTAVGARMG